MKIRHLIHHRKAPLVVPLTAGAFALAGVGVGVAALAGGDDPVPPRQPLAQAVQSALGARQVQGVSARVAFTNDLVNASNVPGHGVSPLLAGAEGRVWAAPDGRIRVELQSRRGDAQVLLDGRKLTVYDPQSNTVLRGTLPTDDAGAPGERRHGPPSVAEVERALDRLARGLTIAGPDPTNVADRPAYVVRLSPKRDGGLLGAAELAWDAANGVPLRAAVYAQGEPDPVLELEATDVDFGPVDDAALTIEPAPGAREVALDLSAAADGAGGERREPRGARGVDAVSAKLPFELSAPDELAGLPRRGVHELRADGETGALVTYGKGLGMIAVVQLPAGAGGGDPLASAGGAPLPEIAVGGDTGRELATALGTLIVFERDGVSYVVVGSVPAAAAEAAARGL